MNAGSGPEWGRLGTVVLTVAIFIAPFIALLYSATAGLAMMAAALGAAALLLHGALAATPLSFRRWLLVAIGVDLALAVACIAVVVWLICGR